jgi:gluconolactonase
MFFQPKPLLSCIALLLVAIAFGAGYATDATADDTDGATVVTDLSFPEGTIFVKEQLYFVDYTRSDVLRSVGGRTQVVWRQPGCGANGLLETTQGLLVACFDSGTLVTISLDGRTLSTLGKDAGGNSFAAPNDLAAARDGKIYFTASGSSGTPGKVFLLRPKGAAAEMATGIGFANGIGLSPDETTLYVAESKTGRILAFSIAADGSFGPRRDFIQLRDAIPSATPDSLRVDKHGNLFVALYDGGGVAIVSPAAKLLAVVKAPAEHLTNLAISPDGNSLYVTAVDDDPVAGYRGRIVRLPNPVP